MWKKNQKLAVLKWR